MCLGPTDAMRIDNAIQALKKKNDLVLVCLHDMMISLNKEEPPVEAKTIPTASSASTSKSVKKHQTPSLSPSTSSSVLTQAMPRSSAVETTNAELERLLAACAMNTMVPISLISCFKLHTSTIHVFR